jgi:hypothetical protein
MSKKAESLHGLEPALPFQRMQITCRFGRHFILEICHGRSTNNTHRKKNRWKEFHLDRLSLSMCAGMPTPDEISEQGAF